MLNVKILQIIFKLWHIYMCNSENIACVLSASANRFAWGSRTIIHTHCCQCVCAAVYRIGARPLNQIIAREHLFLSLSHNTHRSKKKAQSVGRRRRRTRISVSFAARLVPRARNRALAANTMQLILFIYLFAYFVLRARRVPTYIYKLSASVSYTSENNCTRRER